MRSMGHRPPLSLPAGSPSAGGQASGSPPIALTLPAAEPAPINVTIVPASEYSDKATKQSASGPGANQESLHSYNYQRGAMATSRHRAPRRVALATAGHGGE